jgi:hypothetical protein
VIVVAVLAAAGAITRYHFRSSPSALDDTQPVRNGPVPSSSVSAVSSPYVAAGPPADPFSGTPADHWADGAAGIVVPSARSHGEFTAAQVQAAYQETRKLLIAQNLDWPTLRGGAPTAFADLLTSQQRGNFISGLDKIGLDKHGFPISTRIWVTSFSPGTTGFVTTVVKVHGSMSDGYVHPAYPNGARSTTQPSGAPVNPYSTAPPPASGSNVCGTTTGT